jgi:hypothetical protein
MGVQVRQPSLFLGGLLNLCLMSRPDRWDSLPDVAKAQPGLYSNLMSFSAGPRVSNTGHSTHACASDLPPAQSCIGMRFSIIEIKIVIYMLVTNFSFHDTGVDVIKSNV